MENKQEKTLFIIDVMAMAFRNFYAFGHRQLYNSKGLCTSSIYASCQFLFNILKEEHPDYIVAASDVSQSTFRSQIYPEYKANRSKMPEELSVQIPYIFKLLELMGIKVLKQEGFEADDIIGSLTTQNHDSNLKKYILSSDKDFMQLVDDSTFLYIHKKDSPKVIIDSKAVYEKFGCYPDQIIDYLSLVGDSIDNVPGVAGIGKKGAQKLLEEFGSLDNIFKNLDNISNAKLKQVLATGQENALLSKKLVIIKRDLDLGCNLEDLKINSESFKKKELEEFFLDLEFKKFINFLNQDLSSSSSSSNFTSTKPSSSLVSPVSPVSSESEKSSKLDIKQDSFFLKEKDQFSSNLLKDYYLVNSLDLFNSFKEKISSCNDISFFTHRFLSQNTQLSEYLSGISFSFHEGSTLYSYFVPLSSKNPDTTSYIAFIKQILESSLIQKRTYNFKEAIKYLSDYDINPAGKIQDIMLMEYISDSNIKDFSLEGMIQRSFSSIHLEKIDHKLKDTTLSLQELLLYFCLRSFYIYKLSSRFNLQLSQDSTAINLLDKIDIPFSRVLAKMELSGVYIDINQLLGLKDYIEDQLHDLTQKIYSEAGEEFNINSPSQVQYIIYEKLKIHEQLGITKLKKTQSGYSTDISNLELLDSHPLTGLILEYRKLTTLVSTYLVPLPQLVNQTTGRVHTHFNQVGTATGRISSYEPNLQNIPTRTPLGKKIRQAFCTNDPDSVILAADYSQIELRLLAHFSQDPALVQAFLLNKDIHTATATRIFNTSFDKVTLQQRSSAKTINFGIIYGMGSQRLAKSLGISNKQASDFLKLYFKMYPRIKEYLDSVVEKTKECGYCQTITGRKRFVPELVSSRPIIQSSGKHIAMNSPLQGTAADLIKIAMINIDKAFTESDLKAKMVLQIHDELVFELPNSELDTVKKIVKEKMSSAIKLTVPLVVDIGVAKNWADAH